MLKFASAAFTGQGDHSHALHTSSLSHFFYDANLPFTPLLLAVRTVTAHVFTTVHRFPSLARVRNSISISINDVHSIFSFMRILLCFFMRAGTLFTREWLL